MLNPSFYGGRLILCHGNTNQRFDIWSIWSFHVLDGSQSWSERDISLFSGGCQPVGSAQFFNDTTGNQSFWRSGIRNSGYSATETGYGPLRCMLNSAELRTWLPRRPCSGCCGLCWKSQGWRAVIPNPTKAWVDLYAEDWPPEGRWR